MGGSLGSLGRDGSRRVELRAGRSRAADGRVASQFLDRTAMCERRRLDWATTGTEPLADRDERQPGLVVPRGRARFVGVEVSHASGPTRLLAVIDDCLAGYAVLAREVLQGEPGIPVDEELDDPPGANRLESHSLPCGWRRANRSCGMAGRCQIGRAALAIHA